MFGRVIYPHSYAQHVKSGRTEEELMTILHAAHLHYLPEREGGWFVKKEWKDVLSGGEKQRVSDGFCRPFGILCSFNKDDSRKGFLSSSEICRIRWQVAL
jgi:hypothetical protein